MLAINTLNSIYLIHSNFKVEQFVKAEFSDFNSWWESEKTNLRLLSETHIPGEKCINLNTEIQNILFWLLKRIVTKEKVVFQTIALCKYTFLLVANDITKTNYIIACKEGAIKKSEQKKFLSSYLHLSDLSRRATYSKTSTCEESFEEYFFDLTSFTANLLKANFITQNWPTKLTLLNKEFTSLNLPLTKSTISRDEFNSIFLSKYLSLKSEFLKCGVISPFSYGKSAFINSLLELPILQEDILVKTARVTEIHYQEDVRFIADYNSENGKPILEIFPNHVSLSDRLNHYSSTKESIERPFKIGFPHQSKNKDIIYFDTPGLFGKNESHDLLTEKTLANLDVIIYLLNPMQIGFKPYTDKIIEFQKKFNKPFICVVNKSDLLPNKNDRDMLEEEIRTKILEKFIGTSIFFVSSLQANFVHKFKSGVLTLNDLKRDPNVQVKKNNEIITGRSFNEEHVELLLNSSGIKEVNDYLMKLKNSFQF